MKVPATGRGLPPAIRAETLTYWPFDEMNNQDNAIDIMAAYNLFATNYPVGTSSVFTGVTGNRRFFNAALSQYFVGTGFGGANLATFSGPYTVSVWVRLTTFPATRATFVTHGDGRTTDAQNTRLWFGVEMVGGLPYLAYFSHAAGGVAMTTVHTGPGRDLKRGQWYLATQVVTRGASNTTVVAYLNGERVGGFIATGLSSGGGSGFWSIGGGFGRPGYLTGDISHVSYVARELTVEEIRSDFRRGMLWDLDTSVHLQIFAYSEETGINTELTNLRGINYVMGASLSDEASALCADATIHLRRADNLNSLAPFMNDSPVNRYPAPAGAAVTDYLPRLELRNVVQFNVARIPCWDTPVARDWISLFYGRIDKIDWGKPTIELTCRDMGADLIDCQIEDHPDSVKTPTVLRYGGVPEVAIQDCFDNQIWNTQLGTGKSIGGSVITDAPFYNVRFSGTGLNNMVRGGNAIGGSTSVKVRVQIVSSGTPNQFNYYRNGVLLASNVNITLGAHTLSGGAQVVFSTTTGHVVGDYWEFITPPKLFTPISPGVTFSTYFQDQTTIMDALNQKAEMIGWVVRWKTDPYQGECLCFFDPDRDKVQTDYSLGPNDYNDINQMATDLADIRNIVEVSFPDSTKGGPNHRPTPTKEATYPQASVVRTATQAIPGSTSIAQYGRRYMSIAEEQSSRLDTLAEAITFADTMLKDLSQPRATKSVDMRCMFEIEYNDHVNFLANNVHYSEDEQLAVTSLSHEFNTDGTAKTTINLRGRPSGNRRRAKAKAANSFFGKPDMLKSFDQEGVLGHSRDTMKPHLDVRETDFETARDSPTTNVINHRFTTQIQGILNEPDGWHLTTGVWGETDDAFGELVIVLSGMRSLALLTGTAVILSDFIPVEKAGFYQACATWQSTLATAGPTLTLVIHWYDTNLEDAILLSSDTVFTKAANADDVWQTNRGETQADPDALWAKMEFSRTTVVGEIVYIDSVDFQPFKPSFVGVSSSDLNAQTVNTWVKVTNLDFDTFTASQDGLFDISAQVMIDVDNVAATHSTTKIKLTKNTVDWKFGDAHSRSAVDGDYVTLRVSASSVPLDAGDVIEVYVTDTENNFDIIGGGGETEFTARLSGNQ